MMTERTKEFIPMAEATEIAHRNYLSEFNEKVWPIYQRYGFSRDAALLSWNLDKMRERLEGIEQLLTEPEDSF
jgi:hypothetical protein